MQTSKLASSEPQSQLADERKRATQTGDALKNCLSQLQKRDTQTRNLQKAVEQCYLGPKTPVQQLNSPKQ